MRPYQYPYLFGSVMLLMSAIVCASGLVWGWEDNPTMAGWITAYMGAACLCFGLAGKSTFYRQITETRHLNSFQALGVQAGYWFGIGAGLAGAGVFGLAAVETLVRQQPQGLWVWIFGVFFGYLSWEAPWFIARHLPSAQTT